MCIHLRMLVSNTISISDDVRVGVLIRVTLLEQDSLTLPDHQSSLSFFSGVRVIRCFAYCVVFSRSLFVLLFLYVWPLCFRLVFYLRIIHLVPSNFSYQLRRTSHMELCGSCCSIASVMRTALHTVVCLSFIRFLLVIVWSVLLRFMTSCDPFGVFKLFLNVNVKIHT